jgi:hypothetical protein
MVERTFSDFCIKSRLSPKPVAIRKPEETTKPKIGIGTLTQNDLADPLCGHPDLFGKTILADSHGFEKFFEE